MSDHEVRDHARRALQASIIRAPKPGEDWTVCRFHEKVDWGWPLKWLLHPSMATLAFVGPLGWSAGGAVALFTEKDAREIAAQDKSKISFDAPVPLAAVRWRVRLYSHYDGSEVAHETDDYGEALFAFAAAKGAAERENTPSVRYLVAEMDGRVPRSVLEKVLDESEARVFDVNRDVPKLLTGERSC